MHKKYIKPLYKETLINLSLLNASKYNDVGNYGFGDDEDDDREDDDNWDHDWSWGKD